jgi:hypothetical protein
MDDRPTFIPESTEPVAPLPDKPRRTWKSLRKPPRVGGKNRQRSAITNGRLVIGDGRSTWARRCRDLVQIHIADLGGESECSASEIALIKKACVLITETERRESVFAEAGRIDDAALLSYVTATNTIRRLLESLGLRRRPRNVTPLNDIIAEIDQEEAADGDSP